MRQPVRLYLVGGSVMIDLGLRASTVDIDFAMDADTPAALAEFETIVRDLKRDLNINLELASPADFLPVPAGVLLSSRFVRQYGPLSVYYYHLPSLVIAKAARGFAQDDADVAAMIRSGAVSWDEIEATWSEIAASPVGWLRHEPSAVRERLHRLRSEILG